MTEPIKMPTRSWPTDGLGNELRRGSLCVLRVPETVITCRVADIVQAGTMHGADGEAYQLKGTVTFVMQIPYEQGGGVPQALMLKEPDKQ